MVDQALVYEVEDIYQASAPWTNPPPTLYSRTRTLTNKSLKNSVDEGSFTPNVFRINPYSVSNEKYLLTPSAIDEEATVGSWTYRKSTLGYLGMDAFLTIPTTFPKPSTVTGRQYAVQKAYANLNAADVGAGENLGEIRETLALLHHPFKSLRDLLGNTDMRKLGLYQQLTNTARRLDRSRLGKFERGARIPEPIINTWLEFRYGVRPLMGTVMDIIEMVNKQVKKFDPNTIHTVRGKHSWEETTSKPKTWGSAALYTFTGELICSDVMTARGYVHFRRNVPKTFLACLGLTPANLPELIWELTRLSFVLDWWLDVGTWLGSLRGKYYSSVDVLGDESGVKRSRTVTCKGRYKTTLSSVVRTGSIPACGSYIEEAYERSPNASSGLPHFELLPLDLVRSVDLAALILQPSLRKLRSIK